MSRQLELNKIKEIISIFSEKIKIGSASNELNDNVIAENIFLNIFNLLYDWNLSNFNEKEANFPCIDLGDFDNAVCFQISGTASKKKINSTLRCFFNNDLHKHFKTLYFYFLKGDVKYEEKDYENFEKETFDLENIRIITNSILYKEISNLRDIEKIEAIRSQLERELSSIATPNTFSYHIGVSFAQDIENEAIGVIENLLTFNHYIYTNSEFAYNYFSKKVNNRIKFLINSVPKELDFIIHLNSLDFQKSKWKYEFSRCKIIHTGIKRKLHIFSFQINHESSIPDDLFKYSNFRYQGIYNSEQLKLVSTIASKLITSHGQYQLGGYENLNFILDNFEGGGFSLIEVSKDSQLRIGYELFSRYNENWGVSQYVLFLYDNITQVNVVRDLKKKYFKIFGNDKVIILLKKPKLDSPDERKENLVRKFKEVKIFINKERIFFLDEFLWEKCTGKDVNKSPNRFPLNTFVRPEFKNSSDNMLDFKYVEDFITSDNEPILVIKGSGGIGKTTIAKYINNHVFDKYPNVKTFYIDSQRIVNELIKLSLRSEKLDLYNFYRANQELEDYISKRLDPTLFKLNLDHGNIILIIDGLDEIISKMWDYFDINAFFDSVWEYTDIGRAKVIITCRNHFWNKSTPDINAIETIEILPFDEEMAKSFFAKHFPSSPGIVDKGMKLANSLLGSNKSGYFIPFVLDQAKAILEDKLEDQYIPDLTFKSKYLLQEKDNDYVIYRICDREVARVNQIPVDDQIDNLMDLAVFGSMDVEDNQLDLFRAHPLINELTFQFNYDFFNSFFKNIYLSELMKGEFPIAVQHIKILANFISYGAVFNKEICSRIPKLDENFKFRIYSLIQQIHKFEGIKEKMRRKAISGIFLIALRKLHLEYHSNIEMNTSLLKELFLDQDEIKFLSIVNLTSSDNVKVIFDFSDLTFHNCYFQSYEYFWSCKFNDGTVFRNSYFYDLNFSSIKKSTASKENFDFSSCRVDKVFQDIFDRKSLNAQDLVKNLTNDLVKFFELLIQNKKPINLNRSFAKKRYRSLIVEFEKMEKLLIRGKFLAKYLNKTKGEDYLRIEDGMKEFVIKFLEERSVNRPLKLVLLELNKMYQ